MAHQYAEIICKTHQKILDYIQNDSFVRYSERVNL